VLGFVASSPYFWEEWEIAPNFAENLTVLHLARCRDQTVQNMKMGKIFCEKRDNRPTCWWKLRKSLFTHFGGSLANSLYTFLFRALLSLYYRSPDGAAAERTHRCYAE